MIDRTAIARRAVAVIGTATLAVGCSASDGSQSDARANAEALVSAAQSAGVTPRLTPQVAESLYGDSAPQLCDALDDGVSTTEQVLLAGNPAGRREKLITTDAITYGGLVVKTYCPDNSTAFNDLVADIDGTKSTG